LEKPLKGTSALQRGENQSRGLDGKLSGGISWRVPLSNRQVRKKGTRFDTKKRNTCQENQRRGNPTSEGGKKGYGLFLLARRLVPKREERRTGRPIRRTIGAQRKNT